MFEKNSEKDVTDKIGNLSIKDNINNSHSNLSAPTAVSYSIELNNDFDLQAQTETESKQVVKTEKVFENENMLNKEAPAKVYKSNINKFNFLQTQLVSDVEEESKETTNDIDLTNVENNDKDCSNNSIDSDIIHKHTEKMFTHKEEGNITDDIRLAVGHTIPPMVDITPNINNTPVEKTETIKHDQDPEISISVPPRRKKQLSSPDKVSIPSVTTKIENDEPPAKEYPDHLNPFSDDEDDEVKFIRKEQCLKEVCN